MKTMKTLTSHIFALEIPALEARMAVEALEAIADAAIEAARQGDAQRPYIDAGACSLLCGIAIKALREFNRGHEAAVNAARRLPPVVDTSGEPDE